MVRLKVSVRKYTVKEVFYFNSTMVRLKVSRHLFIVLCFPNFNSTMVRLKVDLGRKFSQWALFQFHYGTIKRKRRQYLELGLSTFQFHYGTIKSPVYGNIHTQYLYFNSTMVRLKEMGHRFCTYCRKFQFHYGTIKSECKVVIFWVNVISIPLWYD